MSFQKYPDPDISNHAQKGQKHLCRQPLWIPGELRYGLREKCSLTHADNKTFAACGVVRACFMLEDQAEHQEKDCCIHDGSFHR
jgi:hypothetical protein